MFTAIRNFFSAPHYAGDPERTQDAQTTHRVAVALLGLALFSAPFILRLGFPIREYALYGTFGGFFLWLLAIWLVKRGRTNAAKVIILAINTFNLFAVSFFTGGYSRPTMTVTLFLLALATLLFPRRGAIYYGLIILILSSALFLVGRIGLVPEPSFPNDDFSNFLIFNFTLVSVASILAIAAINSRRNLERIQESEIELRNRNIALNELTEKLEMRVEERTAELQESTKKIQKRADQFETIAQLARTITSIQDPDKLLPLITQQVSQQFGFYHVGLFLLDESRQYAVLSAANSEGGQRMLARKHRLAVGQTGIVGYVTATGDPRIALDIGADAVYFDNPDLPDTRSEMALPLRVGRNIVGALDVQSTKQNAFSEDDVEVLSILADEVSIAIENAHLFEESRRVLADAQSAFGDFTLEAWQQMVNRRKVVGYELSGASIRTLEEPIKDNGSSLSIPIKLREQVIGTMNINLPDGKDLDPDEIDITHALAQRLGSVIETATLLEETRRLATRESLIGDISAKISASGEIERIMQVAVGELRQALGASEVSLRLNEQD